MNIHHIHIEIALDRYSNAMVTSVASKSLRQVSNQVKPQEEALGPQINSLRPSSARRIPWIPRWMSLGTIVYLLKGNHAQNDGTQLFR